MDTPEEVRFRMDGFWDEAYFMVRWNEGEIGEVSGGTIEHIAGNFYLLHATQSQVRIERRGEAQ